MKKKGKHTIPPNQCPLTPTVDLGLVLAFFLLVSLFLLAILFSLQRLALLSDLLPEPFKLSKVRLIVALSATSLLLRHVERAIPLYLFARHDY
jgi:hypothetical protein